MKIIKATIKERYIFSDKGIIRQGLHEINHDIRYFSNREKFHEWYETFKEKPKYQQDGAQLVYILSNYGIDINKQNEVSVTIETCVHPQ